jgi:hypothetical protein
VHRILHSTTAYLGEGDLCWRWQAHCQRGCAMLELVLLWYLMVQSYVHRIQKLL